MRILSITPRFFLIVFFIASYYPVYTQSNIGNAIQQYNAKYDTTIYYKEETFLDQPYEAKGWTLESLHSAVAKHNYTLLRYSPKQYIVLPAQFSETTLANIIAKRNMDAQFDQALSRTSVDTYIINDNEKSVNNEAKVSMQFQDRLNKQILPGVQVYNETNKWSNTSDINGRIEWTTPPSIQQISISMIGYESREIKLFIQSGGQAIIELDEVSTSLNEVTVTEKNQSSQRNPIIGLQQLSIKQIKKLPSLMGQTDILKSLAILPGVSTNADGIGGLSVRGGSADQNLIMMDEMVFYNPNHALGFLSSFNPDFVNGVSLYKGYVPPKYGGRISSVFSTDTRIPNTKKWIRRIGLGLSNSSASIEGPIFTDKTSIAFGGRISHANWLIQSINVQDSKKSSVSFYDYEGKIEHKLAQGSTIGAKIYYGKDAFNLLGEAGFGYSTNVAQMYFKQTLGKHSNVNIRYSRTSYRSHLQDLLSKEPKFLNTGIDQQSLKLHTTTIIKSATLSYGAEWNQYKLSPSYFASSSETKSILREQGKDLSAYAEYQQDYGDHWTINGGLRAVRYTLNGPIEQYIYKDGIIDKDNVIDTIQHTSGAKISTHNYLEPRLAIVYKINESNSVKLGMTDNHQFISMLSNTIAPTPIDVWKSTDPFFKPQASRSYYLSYHRDMNRSMWEASIEAYYTKIDHIQELRDFADIYDNAHLENAVLFGNGKNYGLELQLIKNTGKLNGRISYTFSRAFKQINRPDQPMINGGQWYPSIVDKPHDINLHVNYGLTRRWGFNILFNYNTGQPITIPVNRFSDFNAQNILYYGQRNGYRVPDYHRLDLSINLLPSHNLKRKVKTSWNFAVQNIYARRNAYSLFFRQKPFEKVATYKYSILGTILPSITLNMEW